MKKYFYTDNVGKLSYKQMEELTLHHLNQLPVNMHVSINTALLGTVTAYKNTTHSSEIQKMPSLSIHQ